MIAILLLLSAMTALGQDLGGRWTYSEAGTTAELTLEHKAGRVNGTLAMMGLSLPVEGRASGAAFAIEQMAGSRLPAGQSMTGKLEGRVLVVTLQEPGVPTMTMRMNRADGTLSPVTEGSTAGMFAGDWQAGNDEQTTLERVELTQSGTNISGTITSLEKGYFSGRVSVKQILNLRGTVNGAGMSLRIWDAQGSESQAVPATGKLRGEYLVLRIGNVESAYARPGRALVQSATGNAEAAAFEKAVVGRVFSRGSQASGRGGALAGGRVRLAVCSNGALEYDASDVATTGAMPGGAVDFGNTITRRGTWTIVLRGGRPVLRAQWQGTGTSYSLTAYFDISPLAGGKTALVDGMELNVSGGC